ncbi:MAG: hypothetical protein OEW39_08690, partial [Deltaproteobacteria bacterium]|nr:hypothetical protein [Deltaproteobacteria bacterium]
MNRRRGWDDERFTPSLCLSAGSVYQALFTAVEPHHALSPAPPWDDAPPHPTRLAGRRRGIFISSFRGLSAGPSPLVKGTPDGHQGALHARPLVRDAHDIAAAGAAVP